MDICHSVFCSFQENAAAWTVTRLTLNTHTSASVPTGDGTKGKADCHLNTRRERDDKKRADRERDKEIKNKIHHLVTASTRAAGGRWEGRWHDDAVNEEI